MALAAFQRHIAIKCFQSNGGLERDRRFRLNTFYVGTLKGVT